MGSEVVFSAVLMADALSAEAFEAAERLFALWVVRGFAAKNPRRFPRVLCPASGAGGFLSPAAAATHSSGSSVSGAGSME